MKVRMGTQTVASEKTLDTLPPELEEGKMNVLIKNQILEQLETMPYEFLRKVLDFAQALALSPSHPQNF